MIRNLRHIGTIVLLSATLTATAENAVTTVDGNHYEINPDNGTAKVVRIETENGHFLRCNNGNVPDKVEYQGAQYRVTAIGHGAFAFSDVKEVILPSGIEELEISAFQDCHKLEKVVLPPSVIRLPDLAFSYCENLEEVAVTIPDDESQWNLESIGTEAFRGCAKLLYFNFTPTLSHIGENAFSGCRSLNSVCLYENLNIIPQFAFEGCTGLEYVTLAAREIKMGAFAGCASIISIDVQTPVPPVASSAWDSAVFGTAVLHVPTGTIDAYRSEYPWSEFKQIEDSYTSTEIIIVDDVDAEDE